MDFEELRRQALRNVESMMDWRQTDLAEAINELYADWSVYGRTCAEISELERMYGDGPERS